MNWEEIKEIIEVDGGKFIIVENGKPILVITNFENYKNKLKLISHNKRDNPEAKESQVEKEKVESVDELTIEDLPF